MRQVKKGTLQQSPACLQAFFASSDAVCQLGGPRLVNKPILGAAAFMIPILRSWNYSCNYLCERTYF